ncbi:hypothetical protein HYW40_02965, partial [Candidatus Curtissbacteria bacterium]|nr:hypothetical protein [Candidatus Curtissbacteria bacterium]
MIKTLQSSLIKLLLFALLAFALAIVFTQSALGQSPSPSPSPSASQANPLAASLAYPINELGGCSDYTTCFTYCNDPVNYTACSQFAEQHGFYEEDPVQAPDDSFWQ